MKKRFPFSLILLASGILCVSSCNARSNDDTLAQQQQLLVGIGMILQQRHYSPKPIDDKFSEDIFNNFLSQLDPEKNLFLQSDIDELGQYKDKIDDEILGNAQMEFYPSVVEILMHRISAAKSVYTDILSHPFDFTKDEMFQPIGDSLDYPADSVADREAWRLRLKYRTMLIYSDLLSQRQNAKKADSIKKKTDAELQTQARNQVKNYYDTYFKSRFKTEGFNRTEQFSLFMNTIAHEMDPHTDYFAPVDGRGFNEEMSNSFYGIGAQLGTKDGLITIDAILTGGAVWKSKKVAVGDAILKVAEGNAAPVDIEGYAITDAIKLIRGTKGSVVNLTMKKASDGSTYNISLVREEVKLDYAAAKSIIIQQGNKKIGYLNLPEFYVGQNGNGQGCAADVAAELKKLNAAKIDGLIIDLRTNPGGSLPDVDKIIGYFVPKGPAVQVRDRGGDKEQLSDTSSVQEQPLYTGPLTVMVNEFSASASEIFSAAMQDYRRAIIVGSTSTYGKGTVQSVFPLGKPDKTGQPQYGSLKMTIAKFYRINGGATQLKGVSSDVVLPDPYETAKAREKDNPSALPWDKIEPATYTLWTPAYNRDSVIAAAQARVKENNFFKLIDTTNEWVDKNESLPVSLNIDKYKKRAAFIKSLTDKDTADIDSKKTLTVSVLPEDHAKYYNNPDQTKQKWYQDWLRSLSKDVYIKETVKIVDDMIK